MADNDAQGNDAQGNDPVAEAHGELSLARVALAENDLQHAANHIAGAIAFAPQLPEIHELLAVLAARCSDGGLSLFPLEEHAYIGTVVAHAHLSARNDPGRALSLLSQATAYDPTKPWADASWVRALPVRDLDPDLLVQVIISAMRNLGDPAPPEIRQANEVYLDLARRVLDACPSHAMLHGAAAGLARRLGATALAVRWGQRAVQIESSKATSIWYAYALKADGQVEKALHVMRQAAERNPLDLDIYAYAANWLAEIGRLDEALTLMDGALRVDPSYDCAVHTSYRLRFLRDGDPQHLVALNDFIRDNPVTTHEHTDLADASLGRTWLGLIAGPTEACVNVLAQVPPDDRGKLSNLQLSALEVPSALALLRRQCPNLEIEIAGPPPDDMVNPLRPGRVLWRCEGLTAYPTVEPASAQSVALLTGLAAPSWPHPVAAYDHALPLGQLPVEQLLSLLVHPPARPDEFAELPDGWWERSAQVFACLGILHCAELRAANPGDSAAQRRLLTEIAYGIEDWTTEAALFALTVSAWLDPACRQEVRDAVGRRVLDAVQASQSRVVTILYSLAQLVQIVPGMEPAVSALARDVIAREDAAEAEPQQPERAEPVTRQKRPRFRRFFGR